LPQNDHAAPAISVSPWAAAAWTGGKSDGRYAEIVDGVFGGGSVGIKPKNVEEEAVTYSKMLRATAAFERVTDAASAPLAFEVPEPVSVGAGGDGVYRGEAARRSLFSAAPQWGYGAVGQAYRSLGAVPEDKVHTHDEADEAAARPRQATDLICNPVSCCSVS
jgi:hypothetical protein